MSEADAPAWGSPGARDFWRPVIVGLRESLERRGLADSMMLGVADDERPPREVVEDLKEAAPGVPWVVHAHAPATNLYGQAAAYGAYVWGSAPLKQKNVAEPACGWKAPFIFTAFPRIGCGGIVALRPASAPVFLRYGMEGLLAAGSRGFGRLGADFWPVRRSQDRPTTFLHRYVIPRMKVPLYDGTPSLLGDGRDGAIATTRFELLRLGIQETEARIFLERALVDSDRQARPGDELAHRCRAVENRTRMMLRLKRRSEEGKPLILPDSADLALNLFTAAADVGRILRGK